MAHPLRGLTDIQIADKAPTAQIELVLRQNIRLQAIEHWLIRLAILLAVVATLDATKIVLDVIILRH